MAKRNRSRKSSSSKSKRKSKSESRHRSGSASSSCSSNRSESSEDVSELLASCANNDINNPRQSALPPPPSQIISSSTPAAVAPAAYPFRLPGDTDSEESDNGWSDRDDTEEYEDEEIVWNSSLTRRAYLESLVENNVSLYNKQTEVPIEPGTVVVEDDYDDSSSTDSTSALALGSKHSSDNDAAAASSSPMNVPLIVATTTTSNMELPISILSAASSQTTIPSPSSFPSSSGCIMEDLILLEDPMQDPTRNYDSRYDKALSELQPLSDHEEVPPRNRPGDDDDDDDSFETPWNPPPHKRRHHHPVDTAHRFLKPDTGTRPPTPPSPTRKKCPRPPPPSGFTPVVVATVGSPTPQDTQEEEQEEQNQQKKDDDHDDDNEPEIHHVPWGQEKSTAETIPETATIITPTILEPEAANESDNNNEMHPLQALNHQIESITSPNSDSNGPAACISEPEPETPIPAPCVEKDGTSEKSCQKDDLVEPTNREDGAERLVPSNARELPFGDADDDHLGEQIHHRLQTDTASTSPSSVAPSREDRELAKLNQLRQRDHKLIWFLALGLVCAVIVLAAIVGALVALALSKSDNNIVISTTTTATVPPGNNTVTPIPSSKPKPQDTIPPTTLQPIRVTLAPTTHLRRTVAPTQAPTQKLAITTTTVPAQSTFQNSTTTAPVPGSAVVP